VASAARAEVDDDLHRRAIEEVGDGRLVKERPLAIAVAC
jgi:hypothetical protein